jgi:antagonist of KipI
MAPMALWVADPGGPLTTVQDLGRAGMERFGVPAAGAMDWFALRAANRLVGNPPGAAVLEFAFQGPRLAADRDCLVCVTGGGFHLRIGGRDLPGWTAVLLRAGEEILIPGDSSGSWGYFSVSGGLAVQAVLGSASTYLRGGFGGLEGRALRAGDCMYSREEGSNRSELAGSRLTQAMIPKFAQEIEARVISGPQKDWFADAGMEVFTSSLYHLSASSDRMGYRLTGEPIPRRKGDLLSEGMVFGSIQVPPDGQPIVMMADRPATGGYPKIATVIRADLPKLAQLRPGEGRVRFRVATVAEAQAAYRKMVYELLIETDADELWMTG